MTSAILVALVACVSKGDDTGDTADSGETGDDTGATFTPAAEGAARVCLSSDVEPEWFHVEHLAATVLSDGPYVAALPYGKCGSGLTRAIELDAEGVTWQIAFTLRDDAGTDITPAPSLEAGLVVDAGLGQSCGEGCAYAFSISDDTVILAATEGYWYDSITSKDTPGVSVSAGAVLGEAEDGCGRQAYSTIVFSGDDSVELEQIGRAHV